MNQFKLSFMVFLQYMMHAVWWMPLAAYLTILDVGSIQKSLILSSMAIGCLFSPIIGMLADRYFAAQKVLFALNMVNGVMLLMAGTTKNPDLILLFLIVAMIGYMPSWGLTSSIAMTHLPSEQFPKVRVFGSIGWVTSGIFSLIFIKIFNLNFDGTNIPFYCGAGVSIFAAFTNLALPNTPPSVNKGKISISEVFGLGTLQLMKDRNFAFFILFSFLAVIPFAMYYSYFSEFLLNIKTKYITVTMNWGALAEMGFMLLIPLVIKKYGIRITMILGLVAMIIRYLSLYLGGVADINWMFYIGILVHGLIFGFFFVGGQIYIEKKTPAHLKNQAQGFIMLVTFGAGLLIGNLICGKIINFYRDGITYNWNAIWGITTTASVLLMFLFVLLFKNDESKKVKE